MSIVISCSKQDVFKIEFIYDTNEIVDLIGRTVICNIAYDDQSIKPAVVISRFFFNCVKAI